MSTRTSMLHVRVDEETKARAGETLRAMGLSVSDAVRLFLTRVVAEQAIPFEVKVPNSVTASAMAEADTIIERRLTRFSGPEVMFAELDDSARD